VEEADYDGNIREHIVTASATVCWVMARFCRLLTKKTDDAQAQGPPDQARQPMVDRRHGQGGRQAMRQPRLRRKRLEAPPGPPWACGELVWAWLAGQSRERRMLTDCGHQARACCV
jgi:hypothetical protein